MEKKPKSIPDYYHDNKGRYHSPESLIVNPFVMSIRNELTKDYMEGKESVSEEIQRIMQVAAIIEKDDAKGRAMLADVIKDCNAYFDVVVGHELRIAQRGGETKNYQEEVVYADRLRRSKHDRLITDLAALRRYLVKYYGPDGEREPHTEAELPPTGIYTGLGDDRRAIGLWACRVHDSLAKMSEQDADALGDLLQGETETDV